MTRETKQRLKQQEIRNNEYYNMQNIFDNLYQRSCNDEIFSNLTNLIFSRENIILAYRNIKTNKGSKTPGTDGLTISDIEKMSDKEVCERIWNITKNYHPRPIRRKEIPKQDGKLRPLGIPCIWDRIIQQCILQILQPICEAKFSENSHGFRPLRSAKHAIAQSYTLINTSKLQYVVELDIQGFFDNVNHSKLIKQMWTIGIRDKKLICIIKQILKAEIELPNGKRILPTKGTPQGGVISPLLANIVLNEFDTWIASQWQNHPVTNKYHKSARGSRPASKGTAYRGMRRTTALKEVYAVRYADDIRIFCRTRSDAIKIMHASKLWLKERLKLEVSEEKTRIVNLKKQYMNLLGIKVKMDSMNDFKVKSHICDKSKKNIENMLRKQIRRIQRPSKSTIGKEIFLYNSMVRGVHNYYDMATRVAQDFSSIWFSLYKTLHNRLKWYAPSCNGIIPKDTADFKNYGKAKQTLFIDSLYILPINYVSHTQTKGKRYKANIYTEEGRSLVHDTLMIPNIGIMWEMASKPVQSRSIQYNDNRISRFAGQLGKCAVTGKYFTSLDDIHTHHVTSISQGGGDEYENLRLVKPFIHILIHATSPLTIKRYIGMYELDDDSIEKINKLREKIGNETLGNTL